MKIVVLSYWDFVDKATIARLYPNGFTGWDLEHGGVLETSLMLTIDPSITFLVRSSCVAWRFIASCSVLLRSAPTA